MDKIIKEVIAKYIANAHKQVGVYAATVVNFVYVVWRAVYLPSKPSMLTTLLLHLRFYQRTYMYVLNFVHKFNCCAKVMRSLKVQIFDDLKFKNSRVHIIAAILQIAVSCQTIIRNLIIKSFRLHI